MATAIIAASPGNKESHLTWVYIIIAVVAVLILILWHLEAKRLKNQTVTDYTNLNNQPGVNIAAGATGTGFDMGTAPNLPSTDSYDSSMHAMLSDGGDSTNFYAGSSIGNQLYN